MISICHLIIISLAFLTAFLNDLFITRYIGKNGKTNSTGLTFNLDWAYQKPPPWSPCQSKCRTIRTLACSLVEGIASTAVTKIVVSVQLEPKMAILRCCDFRLPAAWLENRWESFRNHAMLLGNQTCLQRGFLSGTFVFKQNMHLMSSSLATHHSVLPAKVNSWKAAGLGNAKPRGITASLVTFQVFS